MLIEKYIWVAYSVIVFFSCVPNREEMTFSDLDVNISYVEAGANFQQYATYAISDSVYVITGDENNLDSFSLAKVDQVILDEIQIQMNNYGYSKVEINTSPDVGIVVSRLEVMYTGANFVPGFCYPGSGWGWGNPGYGWCYPGYNEVYNYSKGTIIIELLDLKNYSFSDDAANPTIPWKYVANGYINDNSFVLDEGRIRENVSRGFEQSTYLDLK